MTITENVANRTEIVYEDYDKIKTLVDLGYFLKDYVVSGGVATKDVTSNNILNVTEIVVSLFNDVTRSNAARFETMIASTVYYLDYTELGTFNWDTAHYSGVYMPIAQIYTDANKNVYTIVDMRGPVGGLRLKDEYQYPEIESLQAQTAALETNVQTNANDIIMVANEAYRMELSDLVNSDCTVTFQADGTTVAATINTAKPFAPIFFPSRINNFKFTTTLVENFAAFFVVLGGNIDSYTAVALGGSNQGAIYDFDTAGNAATRRLKTADIEPALGDVVQVVASATDYKFTLIQAGTTTVLNWFTITKSDIPSAVGWDANSRLGFVKQATSNFPLFSNGIICADAKFTGNSRVVNVVSTRWLDAKMNVLGDSITAVNVYQNYIKDSLHLSQVNNYGVVATSITADADSDFMSICKRYVDMTDDADLVTVFAGTNDYGLNKPLGSMGDTGILTFYGALDVLIKGLLGKYPTQIIAFYTPLQRNYLSGGVGPNGLGFTLQQYVDAIIAVCAKYSIPVLDLYRNGGFTPLNIFQLTADGLHPNQQGHVRIANKMTAFLMMQ